MQGHDAVTAINGLQRISEITALCVGCSVPHIRFTGVDVDFVLVGLCNHCGHIDRGALTEGLVVEGDCFENRGGSDVGGVREAFGQEIVVGIEPFYGQSAGVGDEGGLTRGAKRCATHCRFCWQRVLDDVDSYRVAFAVAVICGGIIGGAAVDISHLIGVPLTFVVHFAVVPFDICSDGRGGGESHVDGAVGTNRLGSRYNGWLWLLIDGDGQRHEGTSTVVVIYGRSVVGGCLCDVLCGRYGVFTLCVSIPLDRVGRCGGQRDIPFSALRKVGNGRGGWCGVDACRHGNSV